MAVSAGGLAFVAAALLSLVRLGQGQLRWSTVRDAVFLLALAVMFVIQLVQGVVLIVTVPATPAR